MNEQENGFSCTQKNIYLAEELHMVSIVPSYKQYLLKKQHIPSTEVKR
jgi:hypothetical protein